MSVTCRLCEEQADLVESHIVPKFVFRWLRRSSQTGVRQTSRPNLRVQDGWKRPFLCATCEALLNRFETPFASHVFLPFHQQDAKARAGTFSYGDWCLPFCISVSWRVLKMAAEDGLVPELSAAQQVAMTSALRAWREVLLGRQPHPASHPQQLYPVGLIKSAPQVSISPAQNRYFLRSIQIDVLVGPEQMVVFSKLGRLVVVGFVTSPDQSWRGWKVHVRKGFLGIQAFRMPGEVVAFLRASADAYASSFDNMSPRQQQLARAGAVESMEERDEAFVAFEAYVTLSGAAAFRRNGTS